MGPGDTANKYGIKGIKIAARKYGVKNLLCQEGRFDQCPASRGIN